MEDWVEIMDSEKGAEIAWVLAACECCQVDLESRV